MFVKALRLRRLALVAGVLLTATTLAAAEDVQLKVMSFNVRYGTARDEANAWPERRETLFNAIKTEDPDIIGTQECLEFQAEEIAAALPGYRWFGVGREGGAGEMMNVFYRTRSLTPVKTGNFWLSETPEVPGSRSWDTACTRMVTWARFFHIPSRRYITFYNTHFDHVSEEARVNSAQMLSERIASIPADEPVILTGDFNAVAEESEAWKTLTGNGLSDAWLVAKKTEGPAVTFGGFEAPKEERQRRIDWILVRGPISVASCETVLYNEDGRYPSDHYPVAAELSVAFPGE